MHENRILYSLDEYQDRLIKCGKKFSLMLYNETTGEKMFIKPKIKSMWVDKYRENYLAPRKCILNKALYHGSWDFLTLTYWSKKYTARQVADRHKKDIKKFFRNIRKLNKDIQYTYFIEVTEKLYVHFHIFIEQGISEKLYRKIWRACTGSFIVKKKKLNNSKMMINYVNKYVNKIDGGSDKKLEFMYERIDRFFGSSRKFFKKCGIIKAKSGFKLLSNVFISDEFYDLLVSHKKLQSLISDSSLSDLMFQHRFILKILFDDEGDTFISIIKPFNENDFFDFWKLYADHEINSIFDIVIYDRAEFYTLQTA